MSEKVPDEQIQEMFGKFEAEINLLKGVISQFETGIFEIKNFLMEFEDLMKKPEQKAHAKIMTKDGEVIEEGILEDFKGSLFRFFRDKSE